LGSDEHFHDLKKFHLIFKNGTEQFFEGKIKLQKTWNGLIEILFGIQGKENTVEAKKEYQSNQLGAEVGETLLAELFPFASKSLNDSEWNELFGESKKDYWNKYSNTRIALLTSQIEFYKPKVVVFYSTSFSNYWLTIISNCKGEKLDIQRPDLPLSLYKSDSTLFAIIPHPVSIQMNGDIKRRLGQKISQFL
jgi:hypothetical protein